MGALAKGALLVFALLALGFAWELSALVFGYLIVPPLLKRRSGKGDGVGRVPPLRLVLGVLLAGLSAVALVEGGRASPFAFAFGGVLLLVPGPRILRFGARPKPIEDSILLRGWLDPFHWHALAELKISTRDPVRALSGIEGRVLFITSPAPRTFVVFGGFSLVRAAGERRAIARMTTMARGLVPLGVYMLPLDSADASEVSALSRSVRGRDTPGPLAPDGEGGSALLVEARGGGVVRYESFDGRGRGGSALCPPRSSPKRKALLSDMVRAEFGEGVPRGDDMTSFLAGVAATAGEPMGERLTEVTGSEGGSVLVSSPGGAVVPLTRAQLLAVMAVYH